MKNINKFSIPLPYSKQSIDMIIEINKEVKKSKITSLYFSLPSSNELFTGFEQTRNILLDKTDFEFWHNIAFYAVNNGFDVIYCLNSTRPLQINNPEFINQIKRLDKLLEVLYKTGIYKLRVASPKLLTYINHYFPQFELYCSTANDYKIIQEFINLKQIHPYLMQAVPSHNVNKNFKLLKNIQKSVIDIEIMVNEGCLQGCSNRFEHEAAYTDGNIQLFTDEKIFYESYCKKNCVKIEQSNPFLYLAKGNHIFPWEIDEYSKIGIKHFKLAGRDGIRDSSSEAHFIKMTEAYLKGVDNVKDIENYPIINFVYNSALKYILKDLKVKDVIKYLPDIKHFEKYGELCASICGTECRYCFKCGEKIKKVLNKQKRENNNMPFCVISK